MDARGLWLPAAALAAVVVALLAEPLFAGDSRVPSAGGDLRKQFVAARQFGVEQVRVGNLPLWNPHTYSGTPFVGVFQSSLLYPPNLPYLALPLARAISVELALNVLLVGLFTLLWLRGHGLHPLAGLLGALVAMLGAATWLRVLAGQLTVIDTYAWVPLLLLAVDRLAERPSPGWLLAGIAAVSCMILAGHPPTVLMAALVTALYAAPRVVAGPRRLRTAGLLAVVAVAPALLTAVQLFTGVAVAGETLRGEGLGFEAATAYSFPPESLLTWVAWDALGDGVRHAFSRWFYWDTSAYVGIAATLLAIHGALAGAGALRRTALWLLPALVVLALGRYTPAYALVYAAVPGFDLVRAPSKLMFFAMLLVAALAAIGADRLLLGEGRPRTLAAIAAVASALLAAAALWVGWASPAASPVAWLASLSPVLDARPDLLPAYRETLARALSVPAAIGAGAAALLWLVRGRAAAGLLVVAATLELLAFARANTQVFHADAELSPSVRELYRRAGDDRVLETAQATNLATRLGGHSVWGYDPVVLARYARFVAHSQGRAAGELENIGGAYLDRFHPLLRLLRVRYQLAADTARVIDHGEPLPRFLLVPGHRVVADAGAALAALAADGFDPRETVVLEQEPVPAPAGVPVAGSVSLVDESTDHLALRAEVSDAAILLITDAFARGWRARALPGSAQSDYQLLPGDLALRAIPLAAGSHHLRVEYVPAAFRIGAWCSGISAAVLGIVLVGWRWHAARPRRP